MFVVSFFIFWRYIYILLLICFIFWHYIYILLLICFARMDFSEQYHIECEA